MYSTPILVSYVSLIIEKYLASCFVIDDKQYSAYFPAQNDWLIAKICVRVNVHSGEHDLFCFLNCDINTNNVFHLLDIHDAQIYSNSMGY